MTRGTLPKLFVWFKDCQKNLCMDMFVFLVMYSSPYQCINTFIHPHTTYKYLKYPKHSYRTGSLLTITDGCVSHCHIGKTFRKTSFVVNTSNVRTSMFQCFHPKALRINSSMINFCWELFTKKAAS